MTDRAQADRPLEIDRIASSRAGSDSVRLQLSGRWLDPAAADEEELLVVQVQGRRHRFAASRDATPGPSHAWSASFTLPAWAEPRQDGQAALWLGNAVVPVPPCGGRTEVSPPPAPEPLPGSAVGPPAPAPSPSPPALDPLLAGSAALGAVAGVESPRSGPLADLLLRDTVTALHAELEQRSIDAARTRGALTDAQSELKARIATQAALEATQAELRGELERLTAAVQRQRADLEARTSEVERERADLAGQLAELAAARDESSGELAALREQLARAATDVDRHAAESVRLRADLAAASVARDALVSEAASLRAELGRLGTELAAVRERVEAESGDLGEAHRLLAEARAFADQLRGTGGPGSAQRGRD